MSTQISLRYYLSQTEASESSRGERQKFFTSDNLDESVKGGLGDGSKGEEGIFTQKIYL